jgi:hypothetical protein
MDEDQHICLIRHHTRSSLVIRFSFVQRMFGNITHVPERFHSIASPKFSWNLIGTWLGRGKGIGLEDPVFAAASAAEDGLRALAAASSGVAVTLDDYFAARMALLEHVPRANPRFSKLAFGRLAWFPLMP